MVAAVVVTVVAQGEAIVTVLRGHLVIVGVNAPVGAIVGDISIGYPAGGGHDGVAEGLVEGNILQLTQDNIVEDCLANAGRSRGYYGIVVDFHLIGGLTVNGVGGLGRGADNSHVVVKHGTVGEVLDYSVLERTVNDTAVHAIL